MDSKTYMTWPLKNAPLLFGQLTCYDVFAKGAETKAAAAGDQLDVTEERQGCCRAVLFREESDPADGPR